MMFFPYFIYPPAPVDYNLPPTLYSILNSIVNFGEDDNKKIKDLAKYGREEIFDFTYPLSTHINKEHFECLILNHFLMRRIGYDTMTAFKIALNVKLNEIMPNYNKMFDMLDNWDMFNDGEEIERSLNIIGNESTSSDSSNSINQISSTSSVSDRRHSDLPQDRLNDVRDGTYIDIYDYDTDTVNNSSSTSSTIDADTSSDKSESQNETISRTPSDKIKIYKEFLENKTSIYTMIFKDLDVLFYGLV